jgi:hypothetical protein
MKLNKKKINWKGKNKEKKTKQITIPMNSALRGGYSKIP